MSDRRNATASRMGLWILGACALWLVIQNSVLAAVMVSRLDLGRVLVVGQAVMKAALAVAAQAWAPALGTLVSIVLAATASGAAIVAGILRASEAGHG